MKTLANLSDHIDQRFEAFNGHLEEISFRLKLVQNLLIRALKPSNFKEEDSEERTRGCV
jgi:hypothetical protein